MAEDPAGQFVACPWGGYTVLQSTEAFKVKTIEVAPGHRLSYQRHRQRSERWIIVEGTGLVTLAGGTSKVTPGDSVEIAVGSLHRIANSGDVPLVFVEVQQGSYFGEDDIERIEDDYSRAQEIVK